MHEFQYKLVDDGTLCAESYSGDDTSVEIPAEADGLPVTILGDELFKGHKELTSLSIPDSVTDFGEFILDGCVNLRAIHLPASLERLWGYTFVRSGLVSVILPDGIRSIPPFCFKDCKDLEKIVCGAGMRTINAWAFAGCDKLSELVCGPTVKVNPLAFSSKELNT